MFDMTLSKRRRGWEWRVGDSSGNTILGGREAKRAKARYQAERALFLLLINETARAFITDSTDRAPRPCRRRDC
jgi:hypothetical protein